MEFDLKASFSFRSDVSSIKKEFKAFISNYSKNMLEKDKSLKIKNITIQKSFLSLDILPTYKLWMD